MRNHEKQKLRNRYRYDLGRVRLGAPRNHIHFHCNAYWAELTILPTDNDRKRTALHLIDGQRVI